MNAMTKEEAKRIFEKAKQELASWEVVMNSTYTDEQVRHGVLLTLLKIVSEAIGREDPAMRRPGESLEETICRWVLQETGSYIPDHEIEDVVKAAIDHRKCEKH